MRRMEDSDLFDSVAIVVSEAAKQNTSSHPVLEFTVTANVKS